MVRSTRSSRSFSSRSRGLSDERSRARLMILLYLDCDIAFPSPTLAKVGDGAVHGA